MSEEVNKEQTKSAKQEKSTELTDGQLDETAGGAETYMTIENKMTQSLKRGIPLAEHYDTLTSLSDSIEDHYTGSSKG